MFSYFGVSGDVRRVTLHSYYVLRIDAQGSNLDFLRIYAELYIF